jgi:hypothetical protein
MPTKYTKWKKQAPVNVRCIFVKVYTKKDEVGAIPYTSDVLNPHILCLRYERKYTVYCSDDSKDHPSSTWIFFDARAVSLFWEKSQTKSSQFFPIPLPLSILAGWKIPCTEIIIRENFRFLKYFIQHCFICPLRFHCAGGCWY